MQWYAGPMGLFDRWAYFKAPNQERAETMGKARGFSLLVGPHRTKRGAQFTASWRARNNPHCQTAQDADRIAREMERAGETIGETGQELTWFPRA